MAEPVETYQTPSGLKVRRIQPAIGAEVSGVVLGADLPPPVVQDLRNAILAHGVIFFRDQPMDHECHAALGRKFGDLVHAGSDPARPEITPVKASAGAKRDQAGTRWHSDGCYSAVPPSFSILRAIDVKPFGGDTCFASQTAAYEGLSEEMKARIEPLRYTAELAYVLRRNAAKANGFGTDENWREVEKRYPKVVQPAVIVHPETGLPALYVNDGYSMDIVGMEGAEGRALLRTLCDEFNRPEYQVRWTWENDSVAIWDNRAVQHYGVPDPQYDRYLERVTVVGAPTISLRDWAARAPSAAAS